MCFAAGRLVVCLGLVLPAGCGDTVGSSSGTQDTATGESTEATGESSSGVETGETDVETTAAGEPVTYYQHIQPILDARCVACHKAGAVGPFSLEGYDNASMWGEVALEAVEDGTMPPFMPDDSNCQPLEDFRKMEAWERDLLAQWVAQGEPEGDANAPAEVEVEVPKTTLGEPTRVFDAGLEYTPNDAEEDEYRCFLLDPAITDWTFLQAVSIDTNNWSRVHHAIVYSVPPELVGAAQAVDAETPGPGWDCYFGPGLDGTLAVGGYSPGAVPKPYDNGTTIPIAAGTQFIIETHFHQTYNQDPVSLAVTTWEHDDVVTRYPQWLPMFNSNFFIPAGEPSVTAPLAADIIPVDQEPVYDPDPNAIKQGKEGLIWGVDFHMHLRGKTAKVELVRTDGTRECLLWVPRWRDEWQGSYAFKQPVMAKAGDRIEGTCEWDNSPDNQPWVDGVQLDPVDLYWGFDALDEMCNGGVSMTID